MTVDELTQTINKSIKELGFARISRPALIKIFSKGEPAGFDIQEDLMNFAQENNLEIRDAEEEDFVNFHPTSGEHSTNLS